MASTSTGLTPMPGQSAPLAAVTSTDQGGLVLIATLTGLICALFSLLIRCFIRFEYLKELSLDDVLAMLSMFFGVVQSSVVLLGVHYGFGKVLQDIGLDNLLPLQKALYSSDIFFIITVWLTKCSVATLFLRLSPNPRHKMMSYIVLGGSVVTGITSVFLISLKCDLHAPWIFINQPQCTNVLTRWQVITAFDAITELAIFSTSLYLVKELQVPLAKKATVIFAFGLRLPIIAPIAIKLHYLDLSLHSTDPTFSGAIPLVVSQVELYYAIIACSIPCLRPFMTALSTNYGAPAAAVAPKTTRTGGSYGMNSLTNGSRNRDGALKPPQQRWSKYQSSVTVGKGDEHSMESHESKQMIIEQSTEWVVEYEGKDGGLRSPSVGNGSRSVSVARSKAESEQARADDIV